MSKTHKPENHPLSGIGLDEHRPDIIGTGVLERGNRAKDFTMKGTDPVTLPPVQASAGFAEKITRAPHPMTGLNAEDRLKHILEGLEAQAPASGRGGKG